MVQRTPKARFMGGAWVFPGGAVDAPGRGPSRARRRCARSSRRSAITLPDPAALVPFARWITPPEVTIRFDTYFFLAPAPEGAEAKPDGQEIVDARWFEPARALEGSEAGELLMVFPTIKNLEVLARFDTADALLEWAVDARGAPRPAAGRGPGRGGADRARRADEGRGHRPHGELGRSFIRALDAAPEVERIVGMARRPADLGAGKAEYRQGDVLSFNAVEALAARGRRARAPRVHHPRRPRGDAQGQPDRLAQRLRRRRAARPAARLHLVRRRLRLPRRQPAAADRGRPPRAAASTSTTPPRRPSSRVALEEETAGNETYVLRPCIVAGPDASCCCASSAAEAARRSRTRARRSSSCTTTTSPTRSSPPRSA